jgi:PPOX class probable F420-dependent enzyme
MSVELTQEVSNRLLSDNYGWLTTVAKSGQPVPRLIWFYFDGVKLTVYSTPRAAKIAHIKAHPQVSLNLDSDGNGGGIIVVGGLATVEATDVDCRDDEPYWGK